MSAARLPALRQLHFEIYRAGAEWTWRLRTGNNELIASGDSYVTREDCLHAIEVVMSTTQGTPLVEWAGLAAPNDPNQQSIVDRRNKEQRINSIAAFYEVERRRS